MAAATTDKVFTASELSQVYAQTGRLLVCIRRNVDGVAGDVFDVSSAPQFYGPDSGYHIFVGYDSSRALAKSSLAKEDVENTNLSDLAADEIETLEKWHEKFKSKYPIVGTLAS